MRVIPNRSECGMRIVRDLSPGLSRHQERLRRTAVADGERSGKDVEILTLRHRITVLERQLGADARVRFAPEDRAFLAALLTSLPREVLRRLRLLVRPDTVLRRHRDLMRRRHAGMCRPKRAGRPPTVRSIRTLILRLVRENPSWGYRRVHGELAALGIAVASSTVWDILKQEGLDRAPIGPPPRGPTSCAPKPMRCRLATSSRPSPSLGSASTSWLSSSTPAGASACWVPPPIRPRAGSSR